MSLFRALVALVALAPAAWSESAPDAACAAGQGSCDAGAPGVADDEASLLMLQGSRKANKEAWAPFYSFGFGGGFGSSAPKPRVRREWRTLSDADRQKVANAFWVMKNTLTEDGRQKYGKRFYNYDDIVLYHACTLYDPRCDQGHLGPQFMTFHRAFLLLVENSLRSVDPTIQALPYWDYTKDAMGGQYAGDKEKFIFTEKFFGSLYGKGANYQVTDGLFANWSIAEWTSQRFGKNSWFSKDPANACTRFEWFKGAQAAVCDKCCTTAAWTYAKPAEKKTQCKCAGTDKKRQMFRNHDDCTPNVNRWPGTPGFSFHGKNLGAVVESGGTAMMNMMGNKQLTLMYNPTDYSSCTNPSNVRTWMEWQNCVEANQPICGDPAAFVNQPITKNFLYTMMATVMAGQVGTTESKLPVMMQAILGEISRDLPKCQKNFTIYGYYDVLREGATVNPGSPEYEQWLGKARHYVHNMHLTVHQWLGLEYSDVVTSPNDVGPFTGHHSNIDRSHMEWMFNVKQANPDVEAESYYYPAKETNPVPGKWSGVTPAGVNGPWSAGSQMMCSSAFVTNDYKKFFANYKYNSPSSPWTPGTLLDDVVSGNMPYKDLFDCPADGPDCSGGSKGYTHAEIIYWTDPVRAPYTYDTLAAAYL